MDEYCWVGLVTSESLVIDLSLLLLLILYRLRLFVNSSDRSGDLRLVHDREKEAAFTNNSGLNLVSQHRIRVRSKFK